MQVIDLILLYDGDVMKFAGDSMIVAFSPSSEEKDAEDGGLKEATLRCLHCASDLVDKYGEPPCHDVAPQVQKLSSRSVSLLISTLAASHMLLMRYEVQARCV